MFGLDIKRLIGAVVAVSVAVVVISFVGDLLVRPGSHKSAVVAVAAKAPVASAPKEEEKAAPLATLLASADVDAGQKIYRKCKSCHDMTEKQKVGIGPPLWDIVQAAKAGNGKYNYSSTMKEAGGNWTYEDLDAFIASPKGFMKGTKMAFPGIKDAKDRANLIAYLRGLSSSPKPLP